MPVHVTKENARRAAQIFGRLREAIQQTVGPEPANHLLTTGEAVFVLEFLAAVEAEAPAEDTCPPSRDTGFRMQVRVQDDSGAGVRWADLADE